MIAIINRSATASDSDVAFWGAACNRQMLDLASDWGTRYVPVVAFSADAVLPAVTTRVCAIVDSLDVPGALGYHTDVVGDVYARVLFQGAATSVTLSHECLEETIDPTCDKWRDRGNGTRIALEICDPVEADTYEIAVVLTGETRSVAVSNYVLPAWYGGPVGPFDKMRTASLAAWGMTPGGYLVVMDGAGNETDVFARRKQAQKRVVGNPGLSRIQNPTSRVLRRLTHG